MKFDKLSNTRDLGGMKTLDNRQIVQGRLFRSGQLNELSLSDKEKLTQLGPVIIDFRTDAERNERPDISQGDGSFDLPRQRMKLCFPGLPAKRVLTR